MIYIDFPGGAHGNFLEFIICKHIIRVPEYKDFLPFTNLGTSHIRPIIQNKLVKADHYTTHVHIP